MALKKVYIEMDQSWDFWIPGENGPLPCDTESKGKTVAVSEVWLEKLKRVTADYHIMRQVLEHLWRVQVGYTPYKLNEQELKELREATKE